MTSTIMTIATVSIMTMLGGAVQATPKSFGQETHLTNISQATEQLDLSLLAKTLTAFLQSDRYQTESQIQLNLRTQASETTIYLQTKTLTQSGKKFRAEITFTQPGEPAKTGNLVVSDGKQVWIYRSDLKQYSVTSYEAFQDTSEWILASMSSLAFLDFSEQDRQIITDGKLSEQNVLSYIGLSSNSELTGDRRTVNSEVFYVYNYQNPQDGFTLSAFVQPATATLKQVQLVGKTQSLNVIFTEKILNRIANPNVTVDTFQFSPPQNAQKVKSLSLIPL